MQSGSENLEVMSGAVNYLSHIGSLVISFLDTTKPVLELGTGNGTQTEFLQIDKKHLVCVEPNPNLRAILESKGFRHVSDTNTLPDEFFSSAFSINCLEHIADDVAVMREVVRCLKPMAPFVIFVPAFPVLYSQMDEKVGHCRRYSKSDLVSKIQAAGLRLEKIRFVDSVGFAISLIYRFIPSRSGRPSKFSVFLFDRLLFPLSLQCDRVFHGKFGKNLLVVARKPV